MTTDRLRLWKRMLRLWWCRVIRGHHIVSDQVVYGFREPDRYVDGVIVAGDSYEMTTVKCQECGR